MIYEVVLHPDLHSDLKKLSKAQQILVFKQFKKLQSAPVLGALLGNKNGYHKMKKLTTDSVTNDEKDAILSWLDFNQCSYIKRYFFGEDVPEIFKHRATIISSMFLKYDSTLDKKEMIYRGIRFKEKKKFDLFIDTFKESFKNSGIVLIDLAPSSFSRSRKVAYEEFALAHKDDFYSLVFKLVKRRDGELYIKDFAGRFAYQEEIIIKSHESKYKVIDIQESKEYNKTYEITIEEV